MHRKFLSSGQYNELTAFWPKKCTLAPEKVRKDVLPAALFAFRGCLINKSFFTDFCASHAKALQYLRFIYFIPKLACRFRIKQNDLF